MNDESLAPGICVHRSGGGGVENLRLKSKEMALGPPGISVLLGRHHRRAADRSSSSAHSASGGDKGGWGSAR
jgi:hypothetical protein